MNEKNVHGAKVKMPKMNVHVTSNLSHSIMCDRVLIHEDHGKGLGFLEFSDMQGVIISYLIL